MIGKLPNQAKHQYVTISICIINIPIIIIGHICVGTLGFEHSEHALSQELTPTGNGKRFLIFINNTWNTARAFSVLTEVFESLLDTRFYFRYTDHTAKQYWCTLYFLVRLIV